MKRSIALVPVVLALALCVSCGGFYDVLDRIFPPDGEEQDSEPFSVEEGSIIDYFPQGIASITVYDDGCIVVTGSEEVVFSAPGWSAFHGTGIIGLTISGKRLEFTSAGLGPLVIDLS